MSDGFIELGIQSGGNKIDAESLTVASTNVLRQRGQITGASALEIARVLNAPLAESVYALGTRKVPGKSAVQSFFASQVLNVTTVATSSGFDSGPYVLGTVFVDILRNAAAPSFLLIEPEFSDDGGTDWFKARNHSIRYDDPSIFPTGAPGLREAWQIPILGSDIRFVITGGTTGSDTITVTLTMEFQVF